MLAACWGSPALPGNTDAEVPPPTEFDFIGLGCALGMPLGFKNVALHASNIKP